MWRQLEAAHATATSVLDIMAAVRDTNSIESTEDSILNQRILTRVASHNHPTINNQHCHKNLISAQVLNQRPKDLSLCAFLHMDEIELDKILTGENWLAVLVGAVEGLPVAFTLSSVTSSLCFSNQKCNPPKISNCSFPLLFVNRHFEDMTGYNRKNIMGMSVFEILCHGSQESSLISLAALSGRQQTLVVQTKNSKGEIFSNLMAVKPIFDENNLMQYLVTMSFDESSPGVDSRLKIIQAEMIISQLPKEI